MTPEQQRRQVALREMERAADYHGCTDRNWREVDQGDRVVFIGAAKNGREFWIGYMKETSRERLSA